MSTHQINVDSSDSASAGSTNKKPSTWKIVLRENLLAILTVAGVLSGVALGFGLRSREAKWTDREVMYVKFIGDLFLRMLKALILPLIISSLIAAVGTLDISMSGKIGGRAIAYYMITTVLAVVLGIVLVVIIRPGDNGPPSNINADEQTTRDTTTPDTLMDLVR